MRRNLSLLNFAFTRAIAPATFLLNRFFRLDGYVERQKAGISWRLYRPSVLKALILYLLSLILWVWFFGFLAVLGILPVIAAGWVGGLWLGAAFFWALGLSGNGANGVEAGGAFLWAQRLSPTRRLPPELGRVAKWVALAVTPHFLFLIAYNVFGDSGQTSWPLLEAVIGNYEYAAVVLNRWLAPVSDIVWYWWAGFAVLLLLLTFILAQPAIADTGLKLQRSLQSLIFTAAVTGSIGFSYTAPAPNWEPNLQRRLEAHLKQKVVYETSIELSYAIEQWIRADPMRVQPAVALARNFERVLHEAKTSPEHYTQEDIDKAFKKSVRSVVPRDVLDVTAAGAREFKVTGSTAGLLAADANMRAGNRALSLKAAQTRAAAVGFIAQIANVSVTSVPLLNEVVSELIDAAAENAGKPVLDSLPIEDGLMAIQSSDEAVKIAVSESAPHIGPRVLAPEEAGLSSAAGLGFAALKERFFERARIGKAARISAERVRFRPRFIP